MSDIQKQLTEMLNEEKWTRAAIGNYTTKNFEDLYKLVSTARKEDVVNEIKTICDEHLAHTKNSIIALYISSIISLSNQLLDDSTVVSLIEIFIDNHRAQIVEYLCKKFLEYGESKFALRTLAECYKTSGNEEIYDIWERLVKADYDEADIAKLLAEKYEKDGNIEKSVEYYKKALYRFINRKQISGIKEMWSKLATLIPDEIDFFFRIQAKISGVMDTGRSSMLMQDIYQYYRKNENWNIAIDILKLMLSYDEKDNWARDEIVECFRNKYKDHSQLEEYIKVSNLTQAWRPVFDAIADFEKHISFDTGCFVFHRTWGVGRIASVQNDELVIDFAKKRGHKMSLKMGITALQTLDREHIWVLKSTLNKDSLGKKIKAEPEWALKAVIKSFDNNCDMKRVKQELVPSLLTASEWTSWNTKARKILKENPIFGINPDNIDFYTVRERPISLEEKLSNEFKAQKNFFARIELLNAYDSSEVCDDESDTFREMLDYFEGFLKSVNQVNEQIISAYILVREFAADKSLAVPGKAYNFAELYSRIENVTELYSAIKDKVSVRGQTIRQKFLKYIKNLIPNWEKEYIKLFPSVLAPEILQALIEEGAVNEVRELVKDCFENYRIYRNAVIWFFKNIQEEEWFKTLGITFEQQLIVLIHILDITYREISSHRNTTENRKINHQVHSILFDKGNLLENFILESDVDTITRLYTLIGDIKDLDPMIKMSIRARIVEKHKDFKFFDIEEKTVTAHGLIVTSKMFDIKTKELIEIRDVKIPQNSKDVGAALALGDLRENAEFKAAKEEQNRLNNALARLQDELDRAQVFDPTTATSKKVYFGSKVKVLNNLTNAEEEYTILGPWESDPSNGIISYMSPLGNGLFNRKSGEEFEFEVNEEKRSYKILDISIANLK
ncbi:transcription elongation factor GreA [Treponema pedis]|nr:transcription elongation factor GreA [Treponema pedis]QOW60698.1 transcription elongation factor GreA [Treponema pedis]